MRAETILFSPSWYFRCLAQTHAQNNSMINAELNEAQAGIKIARRIINNFRYGDGTTLMANCEVLKSLLIKVKEDSEKLA